jgi:hypothetical protein
MLSFSPKYAFLSFSLFLFALSFYGFLSFAFKETLNKGGPALLADLNLIRETTSHDFSA